MWKHTLKNMFLRQWTFLQTGLFLFLTLKMTRSMLLKNMNNSPSVLDWLLRNLTLPMMIMRLSFTFKNKIFLTQINLHITSWLKLQIYKVGICIRTLVHWLFIHGLLNSLQGRKQILLWIKLNHYIIRKWDTHQCILCHLKIFPQWPHNN